MWCNIIAPWSRGRAFQVLKAWQRSYSPALAVLKGERVSLGASDEDWPGWRWCRNAAGLGGWLPESLLSIGSDAKTAILRESFNTAELTAQAGGQVEGFDECNGWIWCRDQAGNEGWLPRDCLATV